MKEFSGEGTSSMTHDSQQTVFFSRKEGDRSGAFERALCSRRWIRSVRRETKNRTANHEACFQASLCYNKSFLSTSFHGNEPLLTMRQKTPTSLIDMKVTQRLFWGHLHYNVQCETFSNATTWISSLLLFLNPRKISVNDLKMHKYWLFKDSKDFFCLFKKQL